MTTRGSDDAGFLLVEGLTKRFRAERSDRQLTFGVRDVSLQVAAGEMVALLGPSGSGKSTLLRCIAGLERPDAGTISIGGRRVFSAPERIDRRPAQRNLGLIFQTYALWPNMTVRQNVEYPLVRRGVPSHLRAGAVSRYLDMVGCLALAERYPHEISGGQQQRVALARSLVYEPPLILFDEPLSNLDAALREQLRYQIRELQRKLGFTGVYVTHDQREAFLLADRVAVIRGGEIVQLDTPHALYARPRTREVADFLGASNAAMGVVRSRDGHRYFETADGQSIDVTSLPVVEGRASPGQDAVLVVRPDDAWIRPDDGGPGLRATVTDAMALGKSIEYLCTLDAGERWRCRAHTAGGVPLPTGSRVRVTIGDADAYVFFLDGELTPHLKEGAA